MADSILVEDAEFSFENVYAPCPSCGHANVFSRVSDLNYSAAGVGMASCLNPSCAVRLRIGGDLLNPRHQLLLIDCGRLFSEKRYMGYLTSYATASIYTYHSRGGILPKPVRNGRGNPRWSACAIARWSAGTLPPEEIQPVRDTGCTR